MNLTDINLVELPHKSRRRIGRGRASGQGCTAGKGNKGQKARTGHSRQAANEGGQLPLFRRIPKRGFNNYRYRTEYAPVNVGWLQELQASIIDPALLMQVGLVDGPNDGIKVLGEGELTRAVTVKAHKFSATARQKIEAAGGKVEVIT